MYIEHSKTVLYAVDTSIEAPPASIAVAVSGDTESAILWTPVLTP